VPFDSLFDGVGCNVTLGFAGTSPISSVITPVGDGPVPPGLALLPDASCVVARTDDGSFTATLSMAKLIQYETARVLRKRPAEIRALWVAGPALLLTAANPIFMANMKCITKILSLGFGTIRNFVRGNDAELDDMASDTFAKIVQTRVPLMLVGAFLSDASSTQLAAELSLRPGARAGTVRWLASTTDEPMSATARVSRAEPYLFHAQQKTIMISMAKQNPGALPHPASKKKLVVRRCAAMVRVVHAARQGLSVGSPELESPTELETTEMKTALYNWWRN
jgi:hypothetical protein